jgi:aspartyl-tRNA(Asn)/glutamyl-tRNA(Gln) amidotransferase subunit A
MYLERIAREDHAINSFVALSPTAADEARAAASRWRRGVAFGLLDGVPIGLKDNIDVAGLPTTGGIAHYRDSIARMDAFCVARLRAAGAVIVGKLNLHEGALGTTTDNAFLGRCHNPLRHGFTPGGSSGGSGAAVAAGLCAAALGTDTLGSVRLPAAYCGVAGIKPGLGLVSTRGVMPLSWTLDHVGVLAPTVADLLPVLHVVGGFDPSCFASIRAQDRLPDRLQGGVSKHKRIGRLAVVDTYDLPAAIRDAYAHSLQVLSELDHEIVPIALPDIDLTAMRRTALLIIEIEAALVHRDAIDRDPDGFTPAFRAMLAYAERQTASRIAAAYRTLREMGAQVRHAMTELDALVLPTTPQAAFPFDTDVPSSQADFLALANIAGLPAVAVPAGVDDSGLPVSMQVIAPPQGDLAALELAAALEHELARAQGG